MKWIFLYFLLPWFFWTKGVFITVAIVSLQSNPHTRP